MWGRMLTAGCALVLLAGCSEVLNAAGQYTCDSVADEAMNIEPAAGQVKLVGIVERAGPQTDNSDSPPNNGTVYSCTGTGVFNDSTERPIEYGVQARDGQLFAYYEEKL